MSTLVFTLYEMLQRRKRDPFNFISLAPPLPLTPGATRHREKETLRRFTSTFHPPSRFAPVSQQRESRKCLSSAHRPRCGPSLNISRFTKSHLTSRNSLLTNDAVLYGCLKTGIYNRATGRWLVFEMSCSENSDLKKIIILLKKNTICHRINNASDMF